MRENEKENYNREKRAAKLDAKVRDEAGKEMCLAGTEMLGAGFIFQDKNVKG